MCYVVTCKIRSSHQSRSCTSDCTRTTCPTRARSSTSSCVVWRSAITRVHIRWVQNPRVPIRVNACSPSRSASSTRWPASLHPCITTRCLHPTRNHYRCATVSSSSSTRSTSTPSTCWLTSGTRGQPRADGVMSVSSECERARVSRT